ncbi:DUF6044 family protein [Methanoculleus receptaculi]|uniref:DUF6044 family protein n=1 Tax=Methanoculleus receptaculi TaxID=394967 RepID=A0AAX4FS91_9EURY|nr:DUF6044 family protein [Methanoculleus receptaculi]WOX56750.1 DUF6044 family protein [Methanoculleus receptaculi]
MIYLTDFLKEHRYVIVSIIVIALYLTPFYLFGENAPTLVHDNLDSGSHVTGYIILAESGQLFGPMDATIPQVMNGIPRNSFGSEFNVIQWLYLFFEPYTAYIINLTLMHFIAFFGMYLLLTRRILPDEGSKPFTVGVSLAFALLPFWPTGGLSIAGMPLLFYAFLNIRDGHWSLVDWAIIGLMPFYSSFAMTGFFVLVALSIFWLYDLAVTKKPNFVFFLAIGLLCLVYCLVEYRLIFGMFIDPGYISHRVEFAQTPLDFWSALKTSVVNFFYGQYHAVSLHTYFVGLSVAIAALILLLKKKRCDLFVVLLGLCAAISLFYGFIDSEYLLFIKNFPLFQGFQLGRFHWLHPLLWYVIFALALKIIYTNLRYGKQVAGIFLGLQIAFLFTCGGGVIGESTLQYGGAGLFLTDQLTWNEFYSPELFDDIDEAIALPKESYRVVSIGMHPAVSQYNGFYTLDSYQVNYPLDYKHSFRKIMEKELAKSEKNRVYFDTWGSRCYLFVSELEDNIGMNTRENSKPIQNLEIDSEALYDMGGRYIFSAVEILNHEDNNLELFGVFENDSSPWKIWVYSVKNSTI